MKPDDDQMPLDYSSAENERLARIRSLERVPALVAKLGPYRMEGVIEVLTRICLCSNGVESEARVSALAARISTRRVVSERTIQRWVADCEEIGVLVVDRRATRFGRDVTNVWRLAWDRIGEWLAERTGGGVTQGRPRGDSVSPPGVTICRTVCRSSRKQENNRPAAGGASEVSETAAASADRWDAADRARVVARLRSLQFDRAERLTQEAETKLTAAAFASLIDDYEANRRLFAGPGALSYRVREGCWPVDGVKPAAELVVEAQAKAERQAAAAREAMRNELHARRRSIARACGGIHTAEYFERCRRELPPWFVAAEIETLEMSLRGNV